MHKINKKSILMFTLHTFSHISGHYITETQMRLHQNIITRTYNKPLHLHRLRHFPFIITHITQPHSIPGIYFLSPGVHIFSREYSQKFAVNDDNSYTELVQELEKKKLLLPCLLFLLMTLFMIAGVYI